MIEESCWVDVCSKIPSLLTNTVSYCGVLRPHLYGLGNPSHPFLRLTLGFPTEFTSSLKKFSQLQIIWQSQFCLVGEGIGELEGGDGWRRQDEATWGVTCDQAAFLPFFLPHSLQTIPDFMVLEVGLTSLTKRSYHFPTKHFVHAT